VKKKLLLILLIMLVCSPPFSVWGQEITPKGKPVQITSDRLDVYDSKQLAVFSGNVQVNQRDTVINSDELYVFYKKKSGDTKETGTAGAMNAGDMERIEARGRVRIVQGDRIVTGDNAVFFNEEEKVLVTGNAVLHEGKNIIKGGKITFFMKEKRGTVERAEKERVTATIYPKEEKRGTVKMDEKERVTATKNPKEEKK